VLIVANAVARIDRLEFLSDIVPRTVSYKRAVARKEQLIMQPELLDQNGSERKKSRSMRGERENAGRGGIEQYFGSRSGHGNGIRGDDVSAQEDRMEIDD
jgi:hypothetical protein